MDGLCEEVREGVLEEVRRDMDGFLETFRTSNGGLDSEEATIVVDDNQVAKKPTGFDVGERFPGLLVPPSV